MKSRVLKVSDCAPEGNVMTYKYFCCVFEKLLAQCFTTHFVLNLHSFSNCFNKCRNTKHHSWEIECDASRPLCVLCRSAGRALALGGGLAATVCPLSVRLPLYSALPLCASCSWFLRCLCPEQPVTSARDSHYKC